MKILSIQAKKALKLFIKINEDANCRIHIYNSLGVLIQKINADFKAGVENNLTVPFIDKHNGVYFIVGWKKNKIMGHCVFQN